LTAVSVQHHYAHILSCMAENELVAPVLGIAWDGTGFGLDGTIWGGEFLRINEANFERVAHCRTFHLPGGEKAVKEPRRSALGLLFEIFGEKVFEMNEIETIKAFSNAELSIMQKMLANNVNAPVTSSAGRLFDAVASLIGVRQIVRFEGQAAMELEFLIDDYKTNESYEFEINKIDKAGAAIVDWELMIRGILIDYKNKNQTSKIAAKFHNTLVEMMIAVAKLIGEKSIALSGGCFQNKYLLERSVMRLREEKFNVYWHQRVPTNDGGIALGQTLAAARALAENKSRKE
jgi:hydrogenase maturation protein HypF